MRYISILILLGALAGPASVNQQDWNDCRKGEDIDKVVAACTRYIENSSTQSRDRYAALERGLANMAAGTMFGSRAALNSALDDFKAMTELEPQNGRRHDEELAYERIEMKQEHDKAIAARLFGNIEAARIPSFAVILN